jgi:hypothetical protein
MAFYSKRHTEEFIMATSKKPVAPATPKEAPAVAAKPAAKAVVAKPVAAKSAAAPVAKKAAAKAPAAAKPVAVKTAAPVARPKAPAKAKTKANGAVIDPGQRANYIEVAAFYIAERRGFAPGNTEQDYLDAAAEIDRLIAAGHFGK